MSAKIRAPFRGPIFFLILLLASNATGNVVYAQDLAPSFQAVDVDGQSVSLDNFRGEPVILYITNIENPLCRECEKELRLQTEELAGLKHDHPDVNIITINLRKNPYSQDGKSLAKEWWGTEISWPWTEDFEPYPLAGKYVSYWTMDGGFSNPTILLIDGKRRIAEVYHVYQMGKGLLDGIQSSDSLYQNITNLEVGSGVEISATQRVSMAGMFLLGVLTSFSPCSVALMIAVFSYILSSHRTRKGTGSGTTREGLMIGIAFTLGMALIFFVIGLFISQIGVFVRGSRFFDLVAGFLMVLLGVNNLMPLGEILPSTLRWRRDNPSPQGKSRLENVIGISTKLFDYSALMGAFSLGVFFALGWAPCAVSLVFPVIIWLMSQEVSTLGGGNHAFRFWTGPWRPNNSHSHLLSVRERKNRR